MIQASLVAGILAAVAVQRALELLYARRTAKALAAQGATFVRNDGFGLILMVHALWFAGLAAESLVAPYTAFGWWTWPGVAIWLAGGILRYSSMASLGPRWNTRVWVLRDAALVQHGIYQWLRHPIYLGVALELIGLPLAVGAWATALGLLPLHAVALHRRIRREEAALQMAGS